MSNNQNRNILKTLTASGIDGQYFQQLGAQVFNHSGESTAEYKEVCVSLAAVIQDLQEQIATVSKALVSLQSKAE